VSFDRRSVRLDGTEEIRHFTRSARLGTGTLACPRCDVPVALAAGPASPADQFDCPFCGNHGALRDFLSLAAPSRPARVEVRVVLPGA
jgi:hypothetical protein